MRQDPEPATEAIAAAKRIYQRTEARVSDIAFLLGQDGRAFSRTIRRWGWTRRASKARLARHAGAATETADRAPDDLLRHVQDLQRALNKAVRALRPGQKDSAGLKPDETARVLASLTQTAAKLRELQASLRASHEGEGRSDEATDLVELRDRLARHLERLGAAERGDPESP